jgi:hypothetical protein
MIITSLIAAVIIITSLSGRWGYQGVIATVGLMAVNPNETYAGIVFGSFIISLVLAGFRD